MVISTRRARTLSSLLRHVPFLRLPHTPLFPFYFPLFPWVTGRHVPVMNANHTPPLLTHPSSNSLRYVSLAIFAWFSFLFFLVFLLSFVFLATLFFFPFLLSVVFAMYRQQSTDIHMSMLCERKSDPDEAAHCSFTLTTPTASTNWLTHKSEAIGKLEGL